MTADVLLASLLAGTLYAVTTVIYASLSRTMNPQLASLARWLPLTVVMFVLGADLDLLFTSTTLPSS